MSNKQAKNIRQEVRAAVAELLPQILNTELYNKLQLENRASLTEIQKMVTEVLTRIDNRQKDVQGMIMSQIAAVSAAASPAAAPSPKEDNNTLIVNPETHRLLEKASKDKGPVNFDVGEEHELRRGTDGEPVWIPTTGTSKLATGMPLPSATITAVDRANRTITVKASQGDNS